MKPANDKMRGPRVLAGFHPQADQSAAGPEQEEAQRVAERAAKTMTNVALAKLMVQISTRRQAMFGTHLFADPAWDIMLDLYVAHQERRLVSAGSACLASGVPQATAMRWIDALVAARLVEEQGDPISGQRMFVRLSARGYERMSAFLTGVQRPEAEARPER